MSNSTRLTEYRKVHNGHYYYLEYKHYYTITRWFCWSKEVYTWRNIWYPYYDKIWGRSLDTTGKEYCINSLGRNLENFVGQYPDISVYFKEAKIEQGKLEKYAKEWNNEIESKKGKAQLL